LEVGAIQASDSWKLFEANHHDLFHSEHGGDGHRQYPSEQYQIKPLLPSQKNCCHLVLYAMRELKQTHILLRAGTGTGKSEMAKYLIYQLVQLTYADRSKEVEQFR
jgi:hypothetical protein